MFVRKKPNKSGVVSVQVIDKSSGRYRLVKTIGSSNDLFEIEQLVAKGEQYIKRATGLQEIDFNNYDAIYKQLWLIEKAFRIAKNRLKKKTCLSLNKEGLKHIYA